MTRARTSRLLRRRRRGYVLVVTLGLLVLAATLLVSIGRAAVDHALRARRAEADLQQRWGVVSARIVILANADDTLARLEQALHRPVPVYRTSIRLGGVDFALILSDEQAKANVNALIATAGKGSAETRIRDAVSGSGVTNAVFIRPALLPPERTDVLPRSVDGFGQVFDAVDARQLTQLGEACPAEIITCWGDGALNVMRASRASLSLSAGSVLNGVTINRLLKERDIAFAPMDQARSSLMPRTGDAAPNARSTDAVSALLNRARVDPQTRGRLALTSRSTCHSLWVIAGRGEARRHTLFVSDQSNPSDRQIRAFAW